MRSVTTPDGRTLTVLEGGAPDGVPVLAHYGTPSSCLHYAPHARDAEEKGIRLFSYDRPGYGGSTRQAGRSVADCVDDVVYVCDALGIEQFCVWGISGGGPHALATAALLPDRVAAAAALAPVAPFDADGLDFLEGMGEQNIVEFGAALAGEAALRPALEGDREAMLGTTAEQLVAVLETLLSPPDSQVLTGALASYLLEQCRLGLEPGIDGWLDDDLAFVSPWGFEPAAIRVPVLHWQGEQDRFVPFAHGVWLSEHVPSIESRLTPEDGHLTLLEHRVPETHAWLLERFQG
jgi:pimeloyl-ACP methyl ester carboxylesterase